MSKNSSKNVFLTIIAESNPRKTLLIIFLAIATTFLLGFFLPSLFLPSSKKNLILNIDYTENQNVSSNSNPILLFEFPFSLSFNLLDLNRTNTLLTLIAKFKIMPEIPLTSHLIRFSSKYKLYLETNC